MSDNSSGGLRTAALATSVVGGAVAVALLIASGRNNANIPGLVVMFSIWVAFPFAALAWANYRSPRWSSPARTTLQAVTFATAIITLAVFGYRIMRPPATTGAFVFVLVPPVTVVLGTLAVWLAASRRSGT